MDIEQRTESERLAIEYSTSHAAAVRDRAVAAHQILVARCARHMRRRGEPLEDLMQVAQIGLLQALDRFDPTRNVQFSTYAKATINGVLRHHYRASWRLHVPRSVQELALRVAAVIDTLTGDLQRSPTTAEVAERAGVSVDEVLLALDADANFRPLSLSQDLEPPPQPDHLTATDRQIDVAALLERLPAEPRQILHMSFFDGYSQEQIAAQLGLTQLQVSRIKIAALTRLRAVAGDW